MANGKNGNGAQKDAQKIKVKRRVSPKQYEHLKQYAFKAGNPWRIQKGQTLNPGGRPKLLSEAAREFLQFADSNGITNAAKIIQVQGMKAIEAGDTTSTKELRQMTEGDKVMVLKDMTDAELRQFVEDRTRRIGFSSPGDGETRAEKGTEPSKPES